MRLTYSHHSSEANNIKTFFFRPETKLEYTAGQFIELRINHKNPDKRGINRWFTLSSSPTDELISITTKISEPGSSFKKALQSLKSGAQVECSEAMGDFVLPKLIQTPLVFVAGGIGITPFHSILSWLAEAREIRPIELIYSVKTEDEIIFLETFKKASQHVSLVVEEPTDTWGGERGKLSAELILGLSSPDKDSLIYVSGPEPMVEHIEKDLLKSGVNINQLVLDFFPNYKTI